MTSHDNLIARIFLTVLCGGIYLTVLILIITGFDILFKSIIWESIWDLFFSNSKQNPLQRVGIILMLAFFIGLITPIIFPKLPKTFKKEK
tara:strand:+ start:471 stop:740 length:270 start_codon:yes stop_codon:yes gene_type:complete